MDNHSFLIQQRNAGVEEDGIQVYPNGHLNRSIDRERRSKDSREIKESSTSSCLSRKY